MLRVAEKGTMNRSDAGRVWVLPLSGMALLGALLAAPGQGSGQGVDVRLVPPSGEAFLVDRGDEAQRRLRPADAVAAFEAVLQRDPRHYGALWRAARSEVSLGGLATDPDTARHRFAQAVAYARRAVEVRPDGAEGHLWLAVSLGRRALSVGPRPRVEYAREIREEAERTLALDPDNAGAHHVLGAWHAEIRRLNGVTRWIARRLLGGDVFGDASWTSSLHHLEAAVALDSASLTHRLELARVYMDLGRDDDARRQAREVLALPTKDPEDPLHKDAARRLLERLDDGR